MVIYTLKKNQQSIDKQRITEKGWTNGFSLLLTAKEAELNGEKC